MVLSLAGIPLTAGFVGKFYVLTAGTSAAAWALVIVLIISSTVGLVYYLRLIVAMFTDADLVSDVTRGEKLDLAPRIVLAALTLALFMLGVYPGPVWKLILSVSAPA